MNEFKKTSIFITINFRSVTSPKARKNCRCHMCSCVYYYFPYFSIFFLDCIHRILMLPGFCRRRRTSWQGNRLCVWYREVCRAADHVRLHCSTLIAFGKFLLRNIFGINITCFFTPNVLNIVERINIFSSNSSIFKFTTRNYKVVDILLI